MSSNEFHHADKSSLFLNAPGARIAAFVAIGIGIAAMAAGFVLKYEARVWGALLYNLIFFFCLGLGAMALAAITDVIGASWNRPIRRIQEAFGAFVPVASLVFILFVIAMKFRILGAEKVFSWVVDPHVLHHFWGKRSWLIPDFMFLRIIGIVVAISALIIWQLRQAIQRDKAWLEGRYDEAAYLGQQTYVRQKFWSAPIIVAFGVLFTFLTFDVTMALAPTWFSTLWGGWSFAVMMQSLMATLLIVMFSIRNTGFGSYISRQQFHDVGKLMHGFTVFFAYLTFAHVLTYWYGNMPEETSYFILRLKEPWIYFLFVILVGGFILPLYSLIPKAAKWTAPWTITVASIILLSQWCTNMILVMPQVITPEEFMQTKVPFIEVGVFFGVLGLFVTTFLAFAKKVPMVPVADPLLAEALSGHH